MRRKWLHSNDSLGTTITWLKIWNNGFVLFITSTLTMRQKKWFCKWKNYVELWYVMEFDFVLSNLNARTVIETRKSHGNVKNKDPVSYGSKNVSWCWKGIDEIDGERFCSNDHVTVRLILKQCSVHGRLRASIHPWIHFSYRERNREREKERKVILIPLWTRAHACTDCSR